LKIEIVIVIASRLDDETLCAHRRFHLLIVALLIHL
jgi:hypothetical protein